MQRLALLWALTLLVLSACSVDVDGDGLPDFCDSCPQDPYSTVDANGLDADAVCGDLDNVRLLCPAPLTHGLPAVPVGRKRRANRRRR